MASLNHLDRYRQVAQILAKHGLGYLIGELGLERWRAAVDAAPGDAGTHLTNPAHLRAALEELGPTFIKLGQLLSTRSDLLPPEYVAELSKLQSGAPPVPSKIVLQVIRTELGAAVGDLFAEFDEKPLASASIGQAHAAVLKDGTRVVVKVRRPGAVAQIHEDLEILQNLASQATDRWEIAAEYDLVGLVDQFATTIRAELDYLREARNAERFAENFRGSEIHIPQIFWKTTTSRVLTLERITGVKVDDLPGIDRAEIDRSQVVTRAVDAIAQMVFVDGFFHADPHPGNLFIEADGRIGLIDFGMVGAIGDELREHLVALLAALSQDDSERITSALIPLTSTGARIDRPRLRRDVAHFMTLYQGKQLGDLEIGPLIIELLAVLRRHRLQLDPQLVMLVRMLSMVEGIGVRLDPTFNLGVAIRPYATRFAAEQLSPRAIAARAVQVSRQLAALGLELPVKLRTLADSIGPNGIEIHIDAAELEPLVGRTERIGNRLVAAIIASALIGGIGQLTTKSDSRWRAWGGPLMSAGVGAISTLGAYLALTARRHRRKP
ncbi:AarF/ABC1/UbiB kinase family protein [Leifsonia kafniensis]|uniref:AarF/ABC1/UbiB kinase family protein n=1 Tax=Leifsonia kafniensis TaxID=475957 RepID=A0ABP7KAG7_9MICO